MEGKIELGIKQLGNGEQALKTEKYETALCFFREALEIFASQLRSHLDEKIQSQIRPYYEQASKRYETTKEKIVVLRSSHTKMANTMGGGTGIALNEECAEFYKKMGDKLTEQAVVAKSLLRSSMNAYIIQGEICTKVQRKRNFV